MVHASGLYTVRFQMLYRLKIPLNTVHDRDFNSIQFRPLLLIVCNVGRHLLGLTAPSKGG